MVKMKLLIIYSYVISNLFQLLLIGLTEGKKKTLSSILHMNSKQKKYCKNCMNVYYPPIVTQNWLCEMFYKIGSSCKLLMIDENNYVDILKLAIYELYRKVIKSCHIKSSKPCLLWYNLVLYSIVVCQFSLHSHKCVHIFKHPFLNFVLLCYYVSIYNCQCYMILMLYFTHLMNMYHTLPY